VPHHLLRWGRRAIVLERSSPSTHPSYSHTSTSSKHNRDNGRATNTTADGEDGPPVLEGPRPAHCGPTTGGSGSGGGGGTTPIHDRSSPRLGSLAARHRSLGMRLNSKGDYLPTVPTSSATPHTVRTSLAMVSTSVLTAWLSLERRMENTFVVHPPSRWSLARQGGPDEQRRTSGLGRLTDSHGC
jgi:hypothetical protein